MRKLLLLLALAVVPPLAAATSGTSPRTTNNDDSCDIAVMPAATLLLPYFEVDFNAPQTSAVTTLFTIQNVSPQPQIANVTLWTDFGYPALSFPIFLTGYDSQSINLYDVLANGSIAPPRGTSNDIAVPPNTDSPGAQPLGNGANPHFLPDAASSCSSNRLPSVIPRSILQELRAQLTIGRASRCGTAPIGGAHARAIGYATIDVVATCVEKNPSDADYYSTVLLFDNVLTGDYQQVVPRGAQSYALGGPMVHIRAVPEGGPAGVARETGLPYTFYDRFTTGAPSRTFDRRQPLPSTFAAHYIQGGVGGFNTSLRIWREGLTARDAACSAYKANGTMPFVEVIRFDEHENAFVFGSGILILPPPNVSSMPAASTLPTSSANFPQNVTTEDVAGWLYLNLNNGGSNAYSASVNASGIARDFRTNTSTTIGPRQSQNWVTIAMFAEPTYAVEMPATILGNGCSPSPAALAPIGPAKNDNP